MLKARKSGAAGDIASQLATSTRSLDAVGQDTATDSTDVCGAVADTPDTEVNKDQARQGEQAQPSDQTATTAAAGINDLPDGMATNDTSAPADASQSKPLTRLVTGFNTMFRPGRQNSQLKIALSAGVGGDGAQQHNVSASVLADPVISPSSPHQPRRSSQPGTVVRCAEILRSDVPLFFLLGEGVALPAPFFIRMDI
jgi:hypothetical protein